MVLDDELRGSLLIPLKHVEDPLPHDIETTDGVRVDLGDARFLVRPSGTQPLVRVTAEAREAERAETVFEEIRASVDDARP